MEIFAADVYRFPWPVSNVEHVCDLGANVGYSVIYLARLFPNATIDAFEPHPDNIVQLQAMIVANKLGDRVAIHAAAAACKAGTLFLTDAGARSEALTHRSNGCIPVQAVDWFAIATEKQIDFLKIDIEGSEYDLVMDPRFASLRIPYIAMEWHGMPIHRSADVEISARLTSLGYRIHMGPSDEVPECRFGMLWASRARN